MNVESIFDNNPSISDKHTRHTPFDEPAKEPIIEQKRTQAVYVIYSGGLCKIGISWNPEKRIKTIRASCPNPAIIIRIFQGMYAYLLEEALHEYFKEYRVHGEWFDLPNRVIKALSLI